MLKLSIVTPLKKIVTDLEVSSITLPAYKGELTLLDHHEPLVSTLETGIMSFTDAASGKATELVIGWGYFEINANVISVLAETTESKKELNIPRAQKSLDESLQILKITDNLEVIEEHQNKVKKAEARLKLH